MDLFNGSGWVTIILLMFHVKIHAAVVKKKFVLQAAAKKAKTDVMSDDLGEWKKDGKSENGNLDLAERELENVETINMDGHF